MMTPEQRRKKKEGRCRHFTGIMNESCAFKVKYGDPRELPCFGEHGGCPSYSPKTSEEIAADDAEFERHMELMRKGLSSCCESPFDTSQVITSGEHKGHGPRFCSKCGKLCFMV